MEVPRVAGEGAHKAGIPQLYDVLKESAAYYRQQLREHPKAKLAIDYLKERGVAGETAAEFGFGYAPPGWDNASTALGARCGLERLTQAGLLIKKDQGGHYDRFRDRIMFPIRDVRGRVIGFGGRVLGDDTPKYLNSPETEVFHKGRELYGLYEARGAQRQLDRLLVVEGYMDVVMLAQHGIRYAVATLGTATTPHHLERMFRLVPEVVFCFDGDRAGRQAAWRALENTLPALKDGWQARFMFLPEGEDPDSLVRKIQREAFEKRVATAVTLSAYFFESLQEDADTETIDGRARLVELARPYLSKIAPGVFRQLMVDRLCELARIKPEIVADLQTGKTGRQTGKAASRAVPSERTGSLVRKAISLLLRKPAMAGRAQDYACWRSMQMPGIEFLVDMLDLLRDNPHFTTGILLEHWRSHEYAPSLARLARQEELIPFEELDREFTDALNRLRLRFIEHQIAALSGPGHKELREKLELKRLLEEKKLLKQSVNEKTVIAGAGT
jgi:DNA primase